MGVEDEGTHDDFVVGAIVLDGVEEDSAALEFVHREDGHGVHVSQTWWFDNEVGGSWMLQLRIEILWQRWEAVNDKGKLQVCVCHSLNLIEQPHCSALCV